MSMMRFFAGVPPSAELDRDSRNLERLDRFVARKKLSSGWKRRPGRKDRAAFPRRAARRPIERGDRAVSHRPMVRQRQETGGAGDRRSARGQDEIHPAELGEHLFQLDGKHPALVHLAPALVGSSNSGVVRADIRTANCTMVRTTRKFSCAISEAEVLTEARSYYAQYAAPVEISAVHGAIRLRARSSQRRRTAILNSALARRGRARHLVLLRAVAVLDAGLAGRDARAQALLSDLARWSPASTSSSSGSRA